MNLSSCKLYKAAPLMVWLSACTGQVVQYAIPDPIFREMMDIEIAQEIAKNCPNLEVSINKAEGQARIISQLLAEGFRQSEIKPAIQKARQERGRAYHDAYLNVLPIHKKEFCAIGVFEMERKTQIGAMLSTRA